LSKREVLKIKILEGIPTIKQFNKAFSHQGLSVVTKGVLKSVYEFIQSEIPGKFTNLYKTEFATFGTGYCGGWILNRYDKTEYKSKLIVAYNCYRD